MGSNVPQPEHGLDLEAIDESMAFRPARMYTLACGTVTVDPPRRKVLLIFNRKLGVFQLPKGRKHIEETLTAAAVRETFEETGVRAALLPLRTPTRGTRPDGDQFEAKVANGDSDVTVALHADFVGIVRYPDPQAETPGVSKDIFFFPARADSRAPMGDGEQEAHEQLDAKWVGYDEALRLLRFKAERQVVEAVVEAVEMAGLN
jgi:8-oxo-dGTP pyrophosphatase MutT (NUDIX family)